jgi:hypothetical protein
MFMLLAVAAAPERVTPQLPNPLVKPCFAPSTKALRLPGPLEHLLDVLLAVLGRRLQVVQPLPHCVHLGFELLDLRAQLVLERWDGYRNEPGSAG